MKKTILLMLVVIWFAGKNTQAQDIITSEKFGHTLNLGLGIGGYSGYYGYVGRTLPVFHINYEFDVARNFTLAPFITFYTYRNQYYWGDINKNYPYRNYYYKETVVPIGVKGTYYFDQLLHAHPRWDFYLAGSIGFAIVKSSWESNYYGDRGYYSHAGPLFVDVHAGTEYHASKRLGLFLDLSNGVSTFGLAIH